MLEILTFLTHSLVNLDTSIHDALNLEVFGLQFSDSVDSVSILWPAADLEKPQEMTTQQEADGFTGLSPSDYSTGEALKGMESQLNDNFIGWLHVCADFFLYLTRCL